MNSPDARAGGPPKDRPVGLFLPSSPNGVLYRYDVGPSGTPTENTSMYPISMSEPTGVAFSPTGEMFVGSYFAGTTNNTGTVHRFLDPLETPVGNGTIGPLNLPEELLFRKGELFVVNQGDGNIARFTFDAAGNASPSGTISAGLNTNERGIAWNTGRDELLVSLFAQNEIQRFAFDASGNASLIGTPITGGGLSAPHGMALSSWGELFVGNLTGASISRFTFDALGNAVPNGTITGNGVSAPIGVRFSPWGELFVANNAGSVSRFTFDRSHAAVANGSFTTAANYLNWLTFGPAEDDKGEAEHDENKP